MINCTDFKEYTTTGSIEVDLNIVPVWARETIQERTALRIAGQSQVYGEERLNRLQFAVMLAKALNLDPAPSAGDDVDFLDQEKIPAEDLGYIRSLRILGFIEGANGNFNPDQKISRAEAACILVRAMNSIE
jgi:hypothetical protein